MPATFPLELVTPERLLFSEKVQAVRAPGVEGSFGVLAGHAPLLTELEVASLKCACQHKKPTSPRAAVSCRSAARRSSS